MTVARWGGDGDSVINSSGDGDVGGDGDDKLGYGREWGQVFVLVHLSSQCKAFTCGRA